MSFDSELQARSAEIEQQARLVEMCADPATRNAALSLLRSVMELHRSALEQMLAIVAEKHADPGGILNSFARHPLIHSVLMLHDLHPDDLETRVTRALGELQPKLQRYNAEAKLIGVADEVVRVFLAAPAHHGAATEALRLSIEQALTDAAPDAQIMVETAAQPESNFVPLGALHAAEDGGQLKQDTVQHPLVDALAHAGAAGKRSTDA